MKIKVITLQDNKDSVRMTKRCIKSIGDIGEIEPAIDGSDETALNKSIVKNSFENNEYTYRNFYSAWSNPKRSMACLLSHMNLWYDCFNENEKYLILEHDAIFKYKNVNINDIVTHLDNLNIHYNLINLGAPYKNGVGYPSPKGREKIAEININDKLKFNLALPFSNKYGSYLRGTHAYIVTPIGASKLITQAMKTPMPVNFLVGQSNLTMYEMYEFPFRVEESYSTVVV